MNSPGRRIALRRNEDAGSSGDYHRSKLFDSLNPSAIAQQMLLQAMVKHKRHIWFFIAGIGTANLLLGLAIYYGIATWIARLLAQVTAAYSVPVCGAAVLGGAICIWLGLRLLIRTKRSRQDAVGESAAKTPAQLSPLSLFLLGAAFCGVEITSALPYLGFLAMQANCSPVFPIVILFILVYDLVYISPLILLYFGYSKLQGTKAICKLEEILGRISAYIVPAAICRLGLVLLYWGVTGP